MTSKALASRIALLSGAAFCGLTTPAYAQDAAEDEGSLAEIVVTAQKREENLQQTPLAISAIGSEALELRQLSEVKDLGAIAPNVAVNGGTTNATAAVVIIRGIPTAADETQGYDSPIGIYLDGVYLARSSAASFEVADIERVEVLRGPQGTLFGRNTTGGAVNFITREPSMDFGLKLRGGIGNYDQRLIRATLDTGQIGEAMRFSISALHKRRSGTVDNLLQPKDSLDPGGYKIDGFRIAGVVNLSDNLKLTNVFDWTKIDGVPPANQLAEVGNGVVRPDVTIDGATVRPVQPANVAGYLALATVLETQCGTALSAVSRSRLDSICLESAGRSTDKIWGNLTKLEADLGAVAIRSKTALRYWRNNIRGSDLDGLGSLRGPALGPSSTTLNGFPSATLQTFLLLPQGTADFLASQPVFSLTAPLFQASNQRSQKQFSQELEIVSDNDGPFQWVLGGFYFKESGYELNPQRFAFVQDTNLAVYNTTNFGGAAPFLQAANPARYRVFVSGSTLGYRAGGNSKAIYGQGTYRPGGKDGALGITLGLRYTWDHKWVDRFQNGLAPFSTAAAIARNTKNDDFKAPTGHFTIDYRMSDDVNLYARIARGYRSGGFNLRQDTEDNPRTPGFNEEVPLFSFDKETIWSYEAGAKMEFANRFRLNLAAFYNTYSDLQVTVPIPITGGGSFGTQVVNAGKINYMGFEIEALAKLNDVFSLDGSLGYVHKDVKEILGLDITGAPVNLASVFTPGNSPDWTANLGANARFPLSGDAEAIARLGWSYTSKQYMFANPLAAPFFESTSAGSRSLFDGQIRIDGIELGEVKAGLTIWGKNLANKKYVNRGIDFNLFGLGSVIYGDPRTFGATLDIEF